MVCIRKTSLSNDFDTEFLYGAGEEFGDANLLQQSRYPSTSLVFLILSASSPSFPFWGTTAGLELVGGSGREAIL